jgi:hypothetical protein
VEEKERSGDDSSAEESKLCFNGGRDGGVFVPKLLCVFVP